MARLIVFVHGLGADSDSWWGSTRETLESHSELQGDRVKFWGYETSIRGIGWWRRLGLKLGIGRRRQTIRQLGDHLWSDLRSWHVDARLYSVLLIGHSMGGLVVAAALGREPQDRVEEELLGAVETVVLIACPMGGADLAELGDMVAKITGGNIHLEDLEPDSSSRLDIVDEFRRRVMGESGLGLKPIIFRAANDATVLESELTDQFEDGTYAGPRVLTGGHSECIRDLKTDDINTMKIIQALNEKRSEPSADEWFDRGSAHLERGDHEGAVAAYEEAIRLDDRNPRSFNNCGCARLSMGDLDGAIEDFNNAIKINPKHANAFDNRGLTRLEQGDPRGAIADFGKAIAFNKTHFDALIHRGTTLHRQGDLDGAISDYDRAIKLKPRHANTLANRGLARKEAGDVEKAIADLEEAIRIEPGHEHATDRLGALRALGHQ